MKAGQSLMFLEAATIDSPFDRLHLSFMRTVYSTALIFMNKGRNYAYLVDGKSYRTFVLEHYGKSKLTAKLVDKFREDVANGKIKL